MIGDNECQLLCNLCLVTADHEYTKNLIAWPWTFQDENLKPQSINVNSYVKQVILSTEKFTVILLALNLKLGILHSYTMRSYSKPNIQLNAV